MASHRSRAGRGVAGAALAFSLSALTGCTGSAAEPQRTSPPVRLPPRGASFDYQIGGAYPPPPGTRVLSRDRTDSPAPGRYNICYVNAFQVQPGAEQRWPRRLLLRIPGGRPVIDTDWDERLLDLSSADLRRDAAARVGRWIDGCARSGFDAVEFDNYDSYTRSRGLLRSSDATAYLRLLADRAHRRGLAAGQKNTAELAGQRARVGLDFAVTEECGAYRECGTYLRAFDGRVVDVEYTDSGLRAACTRFGRSLSVIRRDVAVSVPGANGYVRRGC
ncbi:endo alpha-1,4 polygalactosaminidase [Streptomyces sp. NPDC058045]|uniref:endo alpha-1,4 polygalactosaminidase n=1 Tax=Streptomyces sp. NPDC058045 TaxID=3346311 RepID=UPI0036EA28B0